MRCCAARRRRDLRRELLLAAALLLLLPVTAVARPLIIAHRGASGERPEHTLAAYERAIDQGADYIEPDLVMTRDGVLIARHENEISGTTDVASRPEFAGRRTRKTIDGQSVEGWFTEDFTLAELKRLRARERLPQLRGVSAAFDGQFEVPTLAEVLALREAASKRTGRVIGIIPEIKHPAYFEGLGLAMEAPVARALADAGFTAAEDPAAIQSFEADSLRRLRTLTAVRLVQLVEPGTRLDGEALRTIAGYAQILGAPKDSVIARDATGALAEPTGLVAAAHAAGLQVHVWTFRNENQFLPANLRSSADPAAHGDWAAEYRAFCAAGIDGLFSDFPAAARAAC